MASLLRYAVILLFFIQIINRIQQHNCHHRSNNPDNHCTNYGNSNSSIGGREISRTKCWWYLDTNLWLWLLEQWLWSNLILPTIGPQVCYWNCYKDKQKARFWWHSSRRMHEKWCLAGMYWRLQWPYCWERLRRLQRGEEKNKNWSGMQRR